MMLFWLQHVTTKTRTAHDVLREIEVVLQQFGFELKGFRTIFGWQSRYVNRAKTNKVLTRKANVEIKLHRTGVKSELELLALVLERRG